MKITIVKITVFALMTMISLNMEAQNKKADLSYVSTVELSADKVWEQMRIMDNIDELSSFVASVKWDGPKGVGGTRVCSTPDGQGYFKEQILNFNDAERSYTWQVVEGVPAKQVINSFKVVDLGLNRSMIVWTSNFEFMENPNMTEEQFRNFLQTAVTEMVENMVSLAK